MKRILPVFSFIILFCLGLGAASVNVTDVTCVEGDDFVKVQFLSDQMASVPRLLPFDEDSLVVRMRFFDVLFDTGKREYSFKSSIVKAVTIDRNAEDTGIYDVDILLKKKYVDYRISTSDQGVFIEFKKGGFSGDIVRMKPEKTATVPTPPGENRIEKVEVSHRGSDAVEFDILMSSPKISYRDIPIYNNPCRLAIDLVNTRSAKIKKSINHLHVKGLRGAYNKPNIYRMVFDLDYLAKYKIQQEGRRLKVRLLTKDARLAKNAGSQSPEKVGVEKKPVKTTTDRKVDPAPVSVVPEPAEDLNPPRIQPLKEEDESRAGAADSGKEESSKESPEKNPSGSQTAKNDDNESAGETEEFFEAPAARTISTDSARQSESQNAQQIVDESTTGNLKTTISGGDKYSGEPMDISIYDGDLKAFIDTIAKETGLNIAMDPEVEGKVSGVFHQVPWDQALDLILRQNGLAMQMEGNILRIADAKKLAEEAKRLKELRESKEMQVELKVFIRELSYAKAADVQKVIEKYLSPRGKIQVDNRTNKLIIEEIPSKEPVIDKLINQIDQGIAQVTIEARIVETKVNYRRNFGIQWGWQGRMDARYGNQTNVAFPNSVGVDGAQLFNVKNPGMVPASGLPGYAINLPAPERNVGTSFSFGNIANTFNLDVALSAMQKEGKGRIISAPKTAVLNNQEAEIIQGEEIPIQTIQNRTVSVRFEQASLELRVTPQITPRGTVIAVLEIHNDAPDFANLVNGIPPIMTQQVKTTVEIKDGDTLVIGGMYRIETDDTSDKVPLLSKIPILGGLFQNSQKYRQQKEVLMFITPRIVK